MKLIVEANSDTGRVRQRNEDIVIIGSTHFNNRVYRVEIDWSESTPPFWIAASDGMGGHQAGEVASQIVAQGMIKVAQSLPRQLSTERLRAVLEQSFIDHHNEINRLGSVHSEWAGMGATFAGLLFYEKTIFMVNIGDSRVYRYRAAILAQLSRDHSLIAMSGNQTAPKNILVNSFGGGSPGIFLDFEEVSHRFVPNDIAFICTDGVTNELTDEEIAATLLYDDSVTILINETNAKGGHDNATFITLKFSETE